MTSIPDMENNVKREDLDIESLGESHIDSPLKQFADSHGYEVRFVNDMDRVIFHPRKDLQRDKELKLKDIPSMEIVGPREKVFFDPQVSTAAIVTCGGLCPGINDVIRGIVMTLYYRYGVHRILGIPYGYQGFIKSYGHQILSLTPEMVTDVHRSGGSFLNSSRGQQDYEKIVDRLVELKIDMLFVIGGDGTQKGAYHISEVAKKRGLKISFVGIPKTIDNDILFMDQSFGFETAFSEAVNAIECAHNESKGAPNGVGIVKLMGRHSGYIACHSALAKNEANFVLIPEVKFELDGEKGFLNRLVERLKKKQHAVVVVAEGAGQEYLSSEATDESGNMRLGDIGTFLKHKIEEHSKKIDMDVSIKYIDPSYMVRSIPAAPQDSFYCLILAENAVHAAMSGKNQVVVGRRHGYYVHLPIKLITLGRKHINPKGYLWSAVLAATGQPSMK